jgi:hypothetical protein
MLAGLPRRIPDGSLPFAGWNAFSSYGSSLSQLAIWMILWVVMISGGSRMAALFRGFWVVGPLLLPEDGVPLAPCAS